MGAAENRVWGRKGPEGTMPSDLMSTTEANTIYSLRLLEAFWLCVERVRNLSLRNSGDVYWKEKLKVRYSRFS